MSTMDMTGDGLGQRATARVVLISAAAALGGFLFGFRERGPLHAQLVEAMKTGKRPDAFRSGAPEWERGEMSDARRAMRRYRSLSR